MREARDTGDRRAVGIRLLEAQPDLAHGLSPEDEADARRHVVALLEGIEVGQWEPGDRYSDDPAFLGLLVVDGMLSRDVELGGRRCSELLGPGDLLRPWDFDEGDVTSLPSESAWTVLEPSRLAVLDGRFTRVACRYPELVAQLVGRTLRRSRWLAILLTISSMPRVDSRVQALMWHLADRWGHVTLDGVVVPVRLTHDMIGRLVGAHRPSVTTALTELTRQNRLSRLPHGWLLRGDPPAAVVSQPAARRSRAALRAVDAVAMLSSLPAVAGGLLG
ncbi:MAG: family transcriptional regulator, cyclic receptor protein [Thermoleophilaceae bacterium]|nr:family transcriptional regulator, cyclic receptor protein [Thermoleophilaceae bacterium]